MGSAVKTVLLENSHLAARVDPLSGAVAEIRYRRAMNFPLIADRGAGIAGHGSLFSLRVAGGPGLRWNLAGQDRAFLLLTAESGALLLSRRIALEKGGSRLSIEDVLFNRGSRDLRLRVGLASRQGTAPWRLAERSWIGGEEQCRTLLASSLPVVGSRPGPVRAAVPVGAFFWRLVGQYGTGFLLRASPPWAGTLRAEVLAEAGFPVEVGWASSAFILPAGGGAALDSEVSVDEGGGAPDQDNAFGPVLVRTDLAAAVRSGDPLRGFATAVSSTRRRVTIQVERVDPGASARRRRTNPHRAVRATVDLVPGKVARLPVLLPPGPRGVATWRATARESGRTLGSAECRVVIDGDARQPAWRRFAAVMPEEHYRGTWEEIGEQMARCPRRIGGPTSIDHTVGGIRGPGNDLAFFDRCLPFYAGLVRGTARAAGVEPGRINLVKLGQRDRPVEPARSACMDVACYGPDGPINAFSKERDGPDFEGLGYVRVVPDRGHAFHVYMHHGVNSVGLSISGATLNEDRATARAAAVELAEWRRSGRRTMPAAVGTWMLLSMCRNVEEALGLMGNPDLPWDSTGNLLLLDRAGRAARVESAGLKRRVFRHSGRGARFFAAGNYPHERADGLFRIGPRWGHAANTMQRERFLREFAGRRQGRLGLAEVFSIMQSHEAGGMCQHHHDNPGQLYSVCSSIAVTRTADLWLTHGPPCQAGYVRHRLNDPFP